MKRSSWREFDQRKGICVKICLITCLTTLSLTVGALRGFAADRESAAGADLFGHGTIPEIRFEISKADMDRLREQPRTYVRATVREGDTVYTNVSVRLKGGPGSFRPLDDKPAFTVNFGRRAPKQKFHGLKKLHLNNSVQDHTYLAEKISRELFEAAGVPAPRAGNARVQLNGRSLGFYVLIEGIDKHFLERHFKDPAGNLYDGHSGSDVTGAMRTNSGENRRVHTALRALAKAAREPDLDTRLAALEQTLDVDRFLSFLATEVMLCHWDGYAMNRNNFRVYHDRALNKMVFLPQGVDQVFQRRGTAVFPPMSGLVAKSVLEVPQLRRRYRERMAELLTNVWQIGPLTNQLYEAAARVRESLAPGDSQGAAYMKRVASFSRAIQQRVRILDRELLSPASDARFDSDGVLLLTGWRPQIDIGSPVLEREPPADLASAGAASAAASSRKGALLHIRAAERSAASWRTRVALPKGHFRFRGRVRLAGVQFDSEDLKSGAGLRISRHKFGRVLPGDTSWITVAFDFEVAEDDTETELVCELRATRGEAWFDESTLRLMRIEQP